MGKRQCYALSTKLGVNWFETEYTTRRLSRRWPSDQVQPGTSGTKHIYTSDHGGRSAWGRRWKMYQVCLTRLTMPCLSHKLLLCPETYPSASYQRQLAVEHMHRRSLHTSMRRNTKTDTTTQNTKSNTSEPILSHHRHQIHQQRPCTPRWKIKTNTDTARDSITSARLGTSEHHTVSR